ncbi:hypothetical protein BURKHO8Y_10465 [Burkholderia sp. 8Y]|nr:hypothetical protein BURKHO8Y_10465 [Burkholderia sp. 8Y]
MHRTALRSLRASGWIAGTGARDRAISFAVLGIGQNCVNPPIELLANGHDAGSGSR